MKRTWATPSGQIINIYQDMLSQPHLMVAGATGSGKSVVINALIYTALYKFPGDTSKSTQFILIDPKRVELSVYKDLPHTICYASEPDTMLSALHTAINITESRYKAMQRAGERKYRGGDVYVIIDEFADLMTTDRRHVQPIIQRLAQIGRAAKVHIILATQCPLAKIIPTEIKVNFDARVGLLTSSAQDSRNILGFSGCELLPKHGQGFYANPEETTLYNLPMIQEDELQARVQWWTDQNKPISLFGRLFKR